jgi:pre-mRNA-splicing helicase BRR2
MFVNSYPTLDVSYDLPKGDFTAGSPILLKVTLARDVDEDEEDTDQTVIAPFYPSKKLANWWVVLGDRDSRQLYVIKKVTVTKSLTVKLEFTLPQGTHRPRLYVVCDSYVGADHDIELEPIEVAEGEESDEDMDSDDDE